MLLVGCGGGGSSQNNDSIETIPLILTIPENTTVVTTIDVQGETPITYEISSGEDRTLFVVDRLSGKLKFKTAPNFEKPSDINQDNLYKLTVKSTNNSGHIINHEIEITVTDIIENATGDTDNDYIPDNIEILINSDPYTSDENNNSELDGLDTKVAFGDTFFDMQWNLRSLGTLTNESGIETIEGNDLNLMEIYHRYMGYNQGKPIIVQVVDTGVDADHEDLEANMDLSRSYSGINVDDPSAADKSDMEAYVHGTMVSGIIAARAFNGKGVRGIAPFAKIAGSNWLENQAPEILEKVWLTGAGANEIVLSNNSWGVGV
jgi:subtilisin family serine protease